MYMHLVSHQSSHILMRILTLHQVMLQLQKDTFQSRLRLEITTTFSIQHFFQEETQVARCLMQMDL